MRPIKSIKKLGLDTLLFWKLIQATKVVVDKILKLKRFDGNLN